MDAEFQSTLRWFASPASGVSAHIVIAADGTIAEVVDPDLIAWHCRELNQTMLGVEIVQPRPGDPISAEQYASLRWWLQRMRDRYGFPLDPSHLPEHWQTGPGQRDGKTDIEAPFRLSLALADGGQEC